MTPTADPSVSEYRWPVRPGCSYRIELSCGIKSDSGRNADVFAKVDFQTTTGVSVSPSLFCLGDFPHYPEYSLGLECAVSESHSASEQLPVRFFIAPPEAAHLSLSLPSDLSIHNIEALELGIDWHRDGHDFISQLESADRAALVDSQPASPGNDPDQRVVIVDDVGLEQARCLAKWHRQAAKWEPALESLDSGLEVDSYRDRMDRLRRHENLGIRVGVIGSQRLREKVEGYCEAFWIRQDRVEDQLAALAPDLILVETTHVSSPGDWEFAFSGPFGELSQSGEELFQTAERYSIPVKVFVTASNESRPLWRTALTKADEIIVESAKKRSTDTQARETTVPLATEPAACSPFVFEDRNRGRILFPAGSDLFEDGALLELIEQVAGKFLLITDFHYDFVSKSLFDRMTFTDVEVRAGLTRSHERLMLQHAGFVLLPSSTLRSLRDLENLALDAIASGSIPVLVGSPDPTSTVLAELDSIENALDFQELRMRYKAFWTFEHRWLDLYNWMMTEHVWTRAVVEEIFGLNADPRQAQPKPKITSITPTKRPWLLPAILERFRSQSYEATELMIVMNTTEPFDQVQLRDNERIFVIPQESNIGVCLNLAIENASGRYWAKMDDDDWYSDRYLESLVNYYRSSQADVCGRRAYLFYFDAHDTTSMRKLGETRLFGVAKKNFQMSGATLSGDRLAQLPSFSLRMRNAADTRWIEDVFNGPYLYVVASASEIIVFRADDTSSHTWHPSSKDLARFEDIQHGTLYSFLT